MLYDRLSIHNDLRKLDHLSLNDLAAYFENQAEMCRNEALRCARTELEKQAAGIEYILRAPRIVMRFLKQGYTLIEGLELTSKEMQTPVSIIERSWKRFLYDKSHQEGQRRNTFIVELAAMGFSNADIGRKVDLHPNTVSNIIGKKRREYHTARSLGQDKVELLLKGSPPVLERPKSRKVKKLSKKKLSSEEKKALVKYDKQQTHDRDLKKKQSQVQRENDYKAERYSAYLNGNLKEFHEKHD